MLIFLTILYNLTLPYLDTLKKHLKEEGISSLTIINSPNLFGHPIGIAILLLIGSFALPMDMHFYLFWFAMIGVTAAQVVLYIWGLVESKFFAVQILSKFGFVTSSVAAILLIHEHLTPIKILALALGILGMCIFAWPKHFSHRNLTWDRGVIFVIISVILTGFSTVFYKMATFYTPSYMTFLSGRFTGDLIGWGFLWIIISIVFLRRSPAKEFVRFAIEKSGRIMIIGTTVSTLLSSWLIYRLPVTTFAMLGILTVPAAYLFSRFKYKEEMTARMWLGTFLIISSVGIFLF